MTNKRKKQKLLNSIVKWVGAVGGIGALLSFLSMVYSFGEKFGEDIKNIEIATMQHSRTAPLITSEGWKNSTNFRDNS